MNSDEVERKSENKKNVAIKPLKPEEFKKIISLIVDTDLVNRGFGKDFLHVLRNHDISYDIETQHIPSSVTFIRKIQDSPAKLDHTLVIWTYEEFLFLHSTKTLLSRIEEIIKSSFDCKFTLLILENNVRIIEDNDSLSNNIDNEQTSEKNHKKSRSKLTTKNKLELEMALAELQLKFNVQYRFVNTVRELGELIIQYSKAFAELPYKLERNKKQDCVPWFAAADSKDCVKVDADGNGLFRLWQEQLHQFSNIGFDVAQAIASEYTSPLSLMNAYDRCHDRKDAELLLQDIQVRRINGPLNSSRRIGPEMSKKIFNFFNNF